MRHFLPILLLCLLLLTACKKDEPVLPSAATEDTTQTEPTIAEETEPEEEPWDPNSLPIDGGDYKFRFDSQKSDDYLDYYLFIPEHPKRDMPLIIFLHGDGEVGQIDNLKDYGMIVKAKEFYGDDFPFIGIQPCTRVITWVHGTIPGTLMELIESTAELYHIDRSKIIITGHSRGAIGTWYLLSQYGNYFSAAVPISCGLGDRIANYESISQVPVRSFVAELGDLDKHYQESMDYIVKHIQAAGGDAELTILKGVHHAQTSTEAFTKDLFEWMLAQ